MMLATPRRRWSSIEDNEAVTLVADLHARPTRTWEGALFDRLLHDVESLPRVDASAPLAIEVVRKKNVFRQPRLPTDPPPLWETTPRPAPLAAPKVPARTAVVPRRRSSWIPTLAGAAAGATTMLLLLDAPARAHVVHAVRALLSLAGL